MAVFITVHPPPVLTTAGAAAAAAPLVLEPLAGMELVLQVRQLLAEIPQTCLYSAFRLVAVTPKGKVEAGAEGGEGTAGGEGGGGDGDVWEGTGDVMNDFVELRSIPAVVARPEKVVVSGIAGHENERKRRRGGEGRWGATEQQSNREVDREACDTEMEREKDGDRDRGRESRIAPCVIPASAACRRVPYRISYIGHRMYEVSDMPR